ncbi:TetR/AcrR family transcriptional regulator [Sphingopyxis sp.]|uniref:TetR/AcrR family transcriptional regulator n=1 Tax=Sphingopyxis sp. TaxID=1908224 RepID=UPI003D10A444
MDEDEVALCQIDRQTPRERRHEAILDAAETLFIEQGYDRTSLAEIVRRSGGSLATLYELFGNKQGLLHAIAVRWCGDTMAERAGRSADSRQSHVETLMDYVRSECDTWRSPRAIALMRMLVSECLRDRDFALQTYRDLHLPFIAEVTELFAGWAEAGEVAIDDPEATAHLFLSIVSGDTMLSRLFGVEDGIPDEDQIRWRLQSFFIHFGIR